jgi:hypothetical protein
MGALDDLIANTGTVQKASGGGALDDLISQTQPQSQPQPDNQETGFMDIVSDVAGFFAQPAAAALEAINYLDKPRGAIAGTVKAAQDGGDLWEGAKKGWKENTSWKETFPEQFQKDNPYYLASIGGFAADVLGDPLLIATPARAASAIAKGSKAVGLTEKVVNPTVKAIKANPTGQSAIAWLEDISGVNRIQDAQDTFRAGRAADSVHGDDIIDAVKGLKKQYGDQANELTRYVEAAERGAPITPATQEAVLKAHNSGKLLDEIKTGAIDKPTAFETLRDVGEEVPDYLLQESQRLARIEGRALPDYIFRDQVLSAIPDDYLRKSIQHAGDMVIGRNKEIQDALVGSGRLSGEAAVRFSDGAHLRRAIGKYDNPEKFLDDLRKNGTEEEWRKAYQDLANSRLPGKQGFGRAHSVETKDFIQRQVLSPDTLRKLGEITDAEYRIMDTLNRGSKSIREDEFLSTVNKMFGKTGDEAADLSRSLPARRQYVQIPEGDSYGALAGKWVPKDVANQVSNSLGTNQPEGLSATLQKMVSWWKVSKLATPAATMRNFYSGIPMANVFGQVPFQSMPKQMVKVSNQFTRMGGKNSPLIRELRETGILGNVWSKQEIRNIIGDNPTGIKKAADIAMEVFGSPDKFWRAVTYSYHRDAGKTIQEAANIANRALFDYSNAPEWVNQLSRSGIVPFAKFPYFATKETAKAMYERPAQVTKYTKPQNQVNNEDREKILPDHIRTRQLLPTGQGTRIVNGKEQPVQNNIDLDYILPFSSDFSVGNPLVDALQLARTGQNSLGQQVIRPGMTDAEKTKEYARFAWNAAGPSFPLPYNYAGETLARGATGGVDRMGRQYDPLTASMQVFGGLKNVPINIDEMYRQNISSVQRQQTEIRSMISSIQRDMRLSKEEKQQRVQAHISQLRELAGKQKEMSEAYRREKKREAN